MQMFWINISLFFDIQIETNKLKQIRKQNNNNKKNKQTNKQKQKLFQKMQTNKAKNYPSTYLSNIGDCILCTQHLVTYVFTLTGN